jgi:hypothetical protein
MRCSFTCNYKRFDLYILILFPQLGNEATHLHENRKVPGDDLAGHANRLMSRVAVVVPIYRIKASGLVYSQHLATKQDCRRIRQLL